MCSSYFLSSGTAQAFLFVSGVPVFPLRHFQKLPQSVKHILFDCRDKNDHCFPVTLPDRPCRFNPIDAIHLYVKKDQVKVPVCRKQFLSRLETFDMAVCILLFYQIRDAFDDDLFIIAYCDLCQCNHFPVFFPICSFAYYIGKFFSVFVHMA